MSTDDTEINAAATQLLGLEGARVVKVADDGAGGSVVDVVTSEDFAGLPLLRGVLHAAEGLPDHPAPTPALRRRSGGYPVAQGPLALHRTIL